MKIMIKSRKARWLIGMTVGLVMIVLCLWNWIFGNSDVESAVYRQFGGELYCNPYVRDSMDLRGGCGRNHPIKKVSSKPGPVKGVWFVTVEADCNPMSHYGIKTRIVSTYEYSFVNGQLTLLRCLSTNRILKD